MSGARKFGDAVNPETGEVVMEMFGPGSSDDAISTGLRIITHQLFLLFPEAEIGGGIFGGEFGYGVNFENDTFLMHRYCWCEKAGECPWCTGCAIYQENGKCVACSEKHPHAPTCYQTEMNLAKKAAGLSYILDGEGFVHVDSVGSSYAARSQKEDRIYKTLCAKHGLDPQFGAAIHCDCGADKARQKATRERGCDYAFGSGIFERFAPYTHNDKRHYYDPPNFWHKASDFRVCWYKYIGRETTTNRAIRNSEWREIMQSTLASIGAPSIEDCLDQYEAASK